MELTTSTKETPKKGARHWESEFTLGKRELFKGKWGMEAKTQYFPVKKQYESFAQLQGIIDNNLQPLKLVKVVDILRDYNGIEHFTIQRDTIRSLHYNVSEFLQYYITLYSHECNTINSKTNKPQCDYGRRRSLVDLYRVCKYYYPLTTLKEVKEALWTLPFGINVFICPDIRRRVHRRDIPRDLGTTITYNNADEFGWDYYCTNVKDSKYYKVTYKDLIPMINKTLNNSHLSPVGITGIDPNIIWYSTNNHNPINKQVKTVEEPTLINDSDDLPF